MKFGIYFLSLSLFAFTSVACGGGEADRQMEEQQKPTSPSDNPSKPSNPSGEPENPPSPPSDNNEEKPTEQEDPVPPSPSTPEETPSEPSVPEQSESEPPTPEQPESDSPPTVSSLALMQHTLEMHSGDRFSMQTTGIVVGTVKWSSSSTAVFIVSSTGVIEAKGMGTATLTVSDNQKTDQCSITVKEKLDGINQQDELLDAKDKESLDITKIK